MVTFSCEGLEQSPCLAGHSHPFKGSIRTFRATDFNWYSTGVDGTDLAFNAVLERWQPTSRGSERPLVVLHMTQTVPTASKLLTILIIEDEVAFRDALEMAISEDGFNVVSASNGEEALMLLERTSPNLILMDIHMPVMDGVEFLSCYRMRYQQRVPVIVCSTRLQRNPADLPEVAAFISKPIDIDDLLNTVHHHVQPAAKSAS